MLLIIKKILAENTRQTILYNAVCSRAVPELIKALGGRGLRTPVGHSLIKPLMRRYQLFLVVKIPGIIIGEITILLIQVLLL
jgi:phosphomannomutase